MPSKSTITPSSDCTLISVALGLLVSVFSASCALREDSMTAAESDSSRPLALVAENHQFGADDDEVTESAAASTGEVDDAGENFFDEAAAIRVALSQGLDVGLAELALSGSEFEQDLARSALMPRLVGVADLGDNSDSLPANASRSQDDDLGAGVYLRQDLLTWGANRKRLKAAGMLTESQESLVEMQKVDTAAAIHVGFATLRRIDGAKNAYHESIAGFRGFLNKANLRSEAGVDSGRSVQEVQSRAAEMEARVAMLEVEEENTKAIIDRLIGSDGLAKFKLYPAVVHSVPTGDIESLGLGNRPDIVALRNELRAAELELGATKADRWPKITISGGVRAESDFEFDHHRSEATASAGSRWVPMAGGAHKARAKLAENGIEVAKLKLNNARRIARAEVRTGLAAVQRARAANAASGRALKLTRKSLELTKAQQEAQRSEIDHVLNVQSRLLRAALQKVDAEFAVQRERVLVKRSLGTMANAGASVSGK